MAGDTQGPTNRNITSCRSMGRGWPPIFPQTVHNEPGKRPVE